MEIGGVVVDEFFHGGGGGGGAAVVNSGDCVCLCVFWWICFRIKSVTVEPNYVDVEVLPTIILFQILTATSIVCVIRLVGLEVGIVALERPLNHPHQSLNLN